MTVQRNVQKSIMQVQSCCFVYLNQLPFCRSRCRRRRRCLSSLPSVAGLQKRLMPAAR